MTAVDEPEVSDKLDDLHRVASAAARDDPTTRTKGPKRQLLGVWSIKKCGDKAISFFSTKPKRQDI